MNPGKILIIQTAFIGDAILSTGFIREVKRGFPQARVDLVTTPVTAELFQFNPYLDNVYPFAKKGIKGIFNQIKLVDKLKKTGYDAAFSLHLSLRSSLILKQSGIPIRIGHPRMSFLTHPVTVSRNLHITDRYLDILKPFIDCEPNSDTELHFSKEQFETAQKIIGNDDIFKLGIAPGSIRNTKKWPREYFITLIREFADNLKIYLIGGPDDQILCEEIISGSGGKALNLAGKLSLLESAALIKKLDLLLTNDSAPMHMANAVNTPVIALMGPTVKEFGFYPYRPKDQVIEVEVDCRPCGKHGGKKCPQKHFQCMLNITPEMTFSKIMGFKKNHDKFDQ